MNETVNVLSSSIVPLLTFIIKSSEYFPNSNSKGSERAALVNIIVFESLVPPVASRLNA